MKYYKLNDGNEIPALGFGTYKITDRHGKCNRGIF